MDGFETRAIRTQTERSGYREHSVPVYMTSSYVFDSAEHARAMFAEEIEGPVYSRYANPNVDEFIAKMATLEGTEDGVATASGMSAMFTSMAGILNSGDHVVASRAIFGSTHQLLSRILPRWGIEHTYVDGSDPQDWEAAVRPSTKMFFLESPSNPGLELIDIEAISEVSRARGIILNVDNCFATPAIQQPAKFGADIVTHSATKLIDGQGRTLGGVILGSRELIAKIRFFARHSGPSLSPFNAWILSKSLETLAIRAERQSRNAEAIARYLEQRTDKVARINYPFLESHPQYKLARKQMLYGGTILSFELVGGMEAGRSFLDNLKMITRSANVGDTRTIATHPASTTHSKLTPEERAAVGISDGLVRISAGLETLDDILADVGQALGKG